MGFFGILEFLIWSKNSVSMDKFSMMYLYIVLTTWGNNYLTTYQSLLNLYQLPID